MKKNIIILIIIVIVCILMFYSIDYNKVVSGQKPIFSIATNKYLYLKGNVYEYIGCGYRILDASEISDYKNIYSSTFIDKAKSYSIESGDKVNIRGYVTNKKSDGSLYVTNNINGETEYNEAWVKIDKNTIILKQSTGLITNKDSITDNVRLEIAFNKVNLEENIPTGVAKFIIILK